MIVDAEGNEIRVGDSAYAVTPRHGLVMDFTGKVVEIREGTLEVAVKNDETDEIIWVPTNRVIGER